MTGVQTFGVVETLDTTLTELQQLAAGTLYPDDEAIPTDFAYLHASLLLARAGVKLDCRGPDGSASSDPSGGVRVEWGSGTEKSVTVVVFATDKGESYIHRYWSNGSEIVGALQPQSPVTLAEWLRWLSE